MTFAGGGRRAGLRLLHSAPLLLLLLLLVIAAALDRWIVSPANLEDVVVQATPIAMLALGAMIVLVSGGIDLSAGFGVSLCAIVVARVLVAQGSLGLALAAVLAVGALLGLINGLLIGTLQMPPFVATLGAMVVVQGVTLFLATGGVLIVADPLLQTIGTGSLGPVPGPLVATGVVAVVVGFLVRGTRFGVRTFALGSSAEAAELSGVPRARQVILIYVLSGVLTALTALLLVGRTAVVTPNIGGLPLLLDAVAATVLGGTSIFGGRGTVSGTLIGALIISLVTNMLRVIGVEASVLDFFTGLIILVALVGDASIRAANARLDAGQPV
ncbi:MAG: ABC transporter permease [Chloroflexota bacterium]|nr:ABC transporter permease [Chloroflexota bacterium]